MSTFDDIDEKFPEREQASGGGRFLWGAGDLRHSTRVPQLTVRARGLRCDCGHELRPHDVELLEPGLIRMLCSSCHSELASIEIL
jgi:hypothetical protein